MALQNYQGFVQISSLIITEYSVKKGNDFTHITLPITGEAGARTQVSWGLSVPLLYINAQHLPPGACCQGPRLTPSQAYLGLMP